MSTLVEIKETIDKIGQGYAEYRQTNDAALAELKKGNDARASELFESLKKQDAALSALEKKRKDDEIEWQLQRDRIEELESRQRTPGKTASEKMHDEHLEAFNDLVRHKGQSAIHERKLVEIERKLIEQKDISVGSQAGGGYALPKVIASAIEDYEIKISPVRRLISVERVTTSDFNQLLNIRGTTSGWAGETDTRGASNTPQLRNITPTWGELYAYPTVTEWALDDLAFNVQDFLMRNVGDEFSYQEGEAVIRGNGTKKPTGMINTTPVTTDDFASPLRAAAAYQYVPSVASPFIVSADSIIDVQYKLNSMYRQGAVYVMNSTTTGSVRKLKDTTNQYLWQPSFQAGQPNLLAGYPTETWEGMDDIGSAKFPVAFGNFNRGYMLVERVGMRVTMDNVTAPGFVKFYIRRREGGIVKNNDAIKFIRTA